MPDIAPDYQTERRMALKQRAVPLPDLAGKRVLDCGTDFGHWAFLAAEGGAAHVLGLDRNREVRGVGPVDLIEMNRRRAVEKGLLACRFERIEMGRQWRDFGQFDVVLVMSVYHHIFECAGGDHAPVWFWLARHCAEDAEIILEGPVDDSDPVVVANVRAEHRQAYSRANILSAASRWFDPEFIGPALHEPTREVWRFRRKAIVYGFASQARITAGAGGAAPAFEYADGRRVREIGDVLGFEPFPGSLNLVSDEPFNWDQDYFRAQILDVARRGEGLDVEWLPRWMRFYPVSIEGQKAWAIKFEGEAYHPKFLELIAPVKLREALPAREAVSLRRANP